MAARVGERVVAGAGDVCGPARFPQLVRDEVRDVAVVLSDENVHGAVPAPLFHAPYCRPNCVNTK
jgi:hypothetical protein